MEGFANVLRHETVGTNIRILVHRPGTTLTEFHSRRLEYDSSSIDDMFSGMCALQADDLAEGIVWQCLQPERVSIVTMETLPTSQRSLYQVDKNWEERNRV
jgi:NADP-dependent 3-hydroxy acid dehydrogenase YdfG